MSKSQKPSPVTVRSTNVPSTQPVRHQDGTPVFAGDLKPGRMYEIDLTTGKLKAK